MYFLKLLLIAMILCFTCSTAEARKRLETYIDDQGVRRISKTGKIYRDYAAIRDFKRVNPKPNDGHAYDIHHIKPLNKGGADKPHNMQWVRTVDHRKKTTLEKQ